jgi:hypothetical protein
MPNWNRADDQTEPMSPAHQEIYEAIEACRQEIRQDLAGWREQHLNERHHPELRRIASKIGMTPTELVTSFLKTADTVPRIVDFIEGPCVELVDGTVERDRDKGAIRWMERIDEKLDNGIKHKVSLTPAQWTFAGTAITALATIAVAMIGNL